MEWLFGLSLRTRSAYEVYCRHMTHFCSLHPRLKGIENDERALVVYRAENVGPRLVAIAVLGRDFLPIGYANGNRSGRKGAQRSVPI